MVCRSTPGNSGITTLARLESGLHDVQVLSLFHELRADADRSLPAPSDHERHTFLTGVRENTRWNHHLSDARRSSIIGRLDSAVDRPVDGRTYRAWQTITDRAMAARQAMNAHFTRLAETNDTTTDRVEAAFNTLMDRDHRIDGQVPEAPQTIGYDATGVPRDDRTRYALSMLYENGPEVTASEESLRSGYQNMQAIDRYRQAHPAPSPADQCADCGQFLPASGAHMCPEVRWSGPSRPRAMLTTGTYDTIAAQGIREVAAGEWETSEGLRFSNRDIAVRSERMRLEERDFTRLVGDAIGSDNPDDISAAAALADLYVREDPATGITRVDSSDRYGTRQAAALGWLHDHGVRLPEWALHPETRCIEETPAGPVFQCGVCGRFTPRAGLSAHLCPGRFEPEPSPARAALDALVAQATANRFASSTSEAELEDRYGYLTAPEILAADGERTHEEQQTELARLRRDYDARLAELRAAHAQPAAARLAPAPPQAAPTRAPAPVRMRTAMRTYRPDEHTQVRMLNVSAVRSFETGETRGLDNVQVRLADDTGNSAVVSGTVSVRNTGQRRTRSRDRYVVENDATEHAAGRGLRCTCPQYRATYDCPHLRQATEHVAALLNQRDPVAVAPAAATEAVAASLRADYDASLTAQQAARDAFGAPGDGVTYATNMEAFQSAWDEAKARVAAGETRLPYMTENATDGLGARDGGRSFGIEIEVDFPDDMTYEAKHRVAREIHVAGLSDSPQVRPWHWRGRAMDGRGRTMGGGYTDDPNMWSVEFDRSVDDVGGQRGCEIVSPILYDTPETWTNLQRVCEIVERNGGKVTRRTGLHINVGAADYDHTVENHNRLLRLVSGYEDVIVRTAHNPESGRTHRGREYCRPITVPAEGYQTIRQAQRSIDPHNYGSSHRAMINLDHVPAEGQPVQNSTRVEVRIFDGSIDPGRIQTNVKVSLGLVNAAARGVDGPRDPEPAGTHRRANLGSNGRMRRLTGEAWERDTASVRALADAIFSREEDKRQLVHAFAASRWQTQ